MHPVPPRSLPLPGASGAVVGQAAASGRVQGELISLISQYTLSSTMLRRGPSKHAEQLTPTISARACWIVDSRGVYIMESEKNKCCILAGNTKTLKLHFSGA
jgi:hypothetical protein